jgi:hypothetical protein
MMPNSHVVTLTISAEQSSDLRRVFPGLNEQVVHQAVCDLAVAEWLAWITGRRRSASLTDLEMDRIMALFERLEPTNEVQVGRLYNNFNLSFGRAQYLARAISDRQIRRLNAAALLELIAELDPMATEYDSLAVKDRIGVKEYRLDLSNRAGKLLMAIASALPRHVRPSTGFERISTVFVGRMAFKVAPKDVKILLDAVNAAYGTEEDK